MGQVMAHAVGDSIPIVDWAVSGRALPGEPVSGDAHLVTRLPGGALVAVVDGLGHGPEAAEAARRAVAMMRAHAGAPVADILLACHQELRKTRGAVISLASLQPGIMTWLGVGNIEGLLFSVGPTGAPARESLLLRSGVVGYQIPSLRPASLQIHAGDTLVFATDGISSRFGDHVPLAGRPQEVADEVLRRYVKDTDDALVLVARYTGAQP
ncbi:MAG TPA: SpoIIE family protein phosphatase [Dongiaceae bacterium]|jgi:serine/threonine protein phosphatase PrpC